MHTSRQISVTLPADLADALEEKVRSGQFASKSEAIREGLRALEAQDSTLENWLSQTVGPAYDAIKANPARGIGISSIRARLKTEHDKTQ